MALEQTLSIIKPDAVGKNLIGTILKRFESAGLKVVGLKMLHLTREQAAGFYIEHLGKSFYERLVDFMVSGPVCVQVLSGENAIQLNRDLMGATNPENAEPGTIRADFAQTLSINAVHGSDSTASAAREIDYFFASETLASC